MRKRSRLAVKPGDYLGRRNGWQIDYVLQVTALTDRYIECGAQRLTLTGKQPGSNYYYEPMTEEQYRHWLAEKHAEQQVNGKPTITTPAERAAEQCLLYLNYDLDACRKDYLPALTQIIHAAYEQERREVVRVLELALRRLEYLLAEETGPCPTCQRLRALLNKLRKQL